MSALGRLGFGNGHTKWRAKKNKAPKHSSVIPFPICFRGCPVTWCAERRRRFHASLDRCPLPRRPLGGSTCLKTSMQNLRQLWMDFAMKFRQERSVPASCSLANRSGVITSHGCLSEVTNSGQGISRVGNRRGRSARGANKTARTVIHQRYCVHDRVMSLHY
jgi:hypothetical protein